MRRRRSSQWPMRRRAVYQLALTGLRNIIGQHDLDEILQERNKINSLLGDTSSGSTAAWGLEVQRFEMKDVECRRPCSR